MKCEIEGCLAAKAGLTLWRVNPKGQPGIWRCSKHLTLDQRRALDPELVRLTSIIEEG